ncbi:MAG TPA: exonuclease domain-containing protein [Methylomirabilota bacterium]|jgi:DNA polymerase-3 subunit epsilon|nr:exonuclease domain-containing protein [Methylomirabilota bacterium]
MDLNKLAFVDVETTGGSALYSRILEIAIIRVENGKITRKFSTVVDPDTHIPEPIKNLTGITDAEVARAPSFYDISREVQEILRGCVFVAHNVRFDYSFIKAEFGRLNMKFQAKQLCTVKLSRKLFPEHPRHNLDAVMQRHNLECEHRHRALDDALVIYNFFQLAEKQFGKEFLHDLVRTIGQTPTLPIYLEDEQVKKIPNCIGVYVFYDDRDIPIYIGKSVNVKTRIKSHFSSDIHDSKEMKISQAVRAIRVYQTQTELGALLLETQMVKEFLPIYNIRLRRGREMYFLTKKLNPDGYLETSLDYSKLTHPSEFPNILAVFKSKRQATTLLDKLSKENFLCRKLMNLEKSRNTCFRYQLKLCLGACGQLEPPKTYNQRLEKTFKRHKISDWPFPREKIVDIEPNKKLIINHWAVVGHIINNQRIDIDESEFAFDLDNYRILKRALLNKSLATS